jgi:hypothetical protein
MRSHERARPQPTTRAQLRLKQTSRIAAENKTKEKQEEMQAEQRFKQKNIR